MEIKILGTGCPKCRALEQVTRQAIADSQIEAQISKVEDIMEIMRYGVMRTPALVVDEKVVLSGRVPSASEVKEILQKAASPR